MATIDTLKTYEALKKVFTEAQAKAVVEVIAEVVEGAQEKQKEVLATKEDLKATELRILRWMVGLWISQIGIMFATLIAFLR